MINQFVFFRDSTAHGNIAMQTRAAKLLESMALTELGG